MARVQFQYLNINPQRRFKNMGFTQKENTGLDTETYQGYVKLICDDSGRHKDINEFYMKNKKILIQFPVKEALKFFWHKKLFF